MEKKKMWWLFLAGVLAVSGCATVNKKDDLSSQSLRNKITALEAQLNEKDNEINSLREALAKNETAQPAAAELNQRPDAKMIQTALKNAGYFSGDIDGKMGKQTRQAVRDFQKANKLHADGKVGKNTWALLKEYLDKKVK